MLPYERFDAWQMAHRLALKIYEITDRWPVQEKYGLTAQIRRAALSAATNIAEGSAKRGSRELRRYLDISLGSLSEVSYLLRFSRDRGLLVPSDFDALDDLRDGAGKLTWRLYSSLRPPGVHCLTALPPYRLTAAYLAFLYISSISSS
jgi:four helix bundle protein